MKRVEIRSKIWMEIEGEPVFGVGRRFLLHAIDRTGSINRAAKEVKVSYRKAWSYIRAMEERLHVKLVHRRTGGKNGGGATLTDEARVFIDKYERLEVGIREIVDAKFAEIFGSTEKPSNAKPSRRQGGEPNV
ncbi:MAG: winged helix-turn-helix domain-containing protein [Syntrophobacteraceae bacterium]